MSENSSYTALIVDDNEIDRLSLQMHLKQFPFIQVTGIYASAEEALPIIQEKNPQVLFLDIDMPGMNGLELRRITGKERVCIFITSHPEFAIDGFELDVLDYIVKPISKERFAATMSRLQDYMQLKHKANLFECSLGADAVFIKDGHSQVKVQLHDILYLEALKDYTRIVTHQKKYCVLSVLGNILQEQAFKTFVRIHRSFAVQKHFISRVTAQHVFLDEISLPIGRSYKSSLTNITGA